MPIDVWRHAGLAFPWYALRRALLILEVRTVNCQLECLNGAGAGCDITVSLQPA